MMKFSHCILLVSAYLGTQVQASVLRRQDEPGAPSLTPRPSASASSSGAQPSASNGAANAAQQSRTLLDSVINPAFAFDGMNDPNSTTENQMPSLTSTNNFINFCATLPHLANTNGTQIREGSCNSVPMGAIPAASLMPSAKITSPEHNAVLPPKVPFTVAVVSKNLATGFATNNAQSYMSAPQQLDSNGMIMGHMHIVIEQVISPNQHTPTDPTFFAFFKGLNTQAADGELKTEVTKGLPAGEYRVCTLTSSANHSPVGLPMAQRGSSEDCTYFKVSESPSTGNGGVMTHTTSFGVALLSFIVPLYLSF